MDSCPWLRINICDYIEVSDSDTHAHMPTYMRAHTLIYMCAYTRACWCTCVHTHTLMYTHTRILQNIKFIVKWREKFYTCFIYIYIYIYNTILFDSAIYTFWSMMNILHECHAQNVPYFFSLPHNQPSLCPSRYIHLNEKNHTHLLIETEQPSQIEFSSNSLSVRSSTDLANQNEIKNRLAAIFMWIYGLYCW